MIELFEIVIFRFSFIICFVNFFSVIFVKCLVNDIVFVCLRVFIFNWEDFDYGFVDVCVGFDIVVC